MLNHQMGAFASMWLSFLTFLTAFRIFDQRLHKELVQEIDALRRQLEQFGKS
jgi:hypothetical protein